ncbi:hypothetical protein EE612_028986 [Oryza sativa]|nr:hypothetical protein EE612_028986 [Oryza sativa]
MPTATTAMAVPPHSSICSLIAFLHHHIRALLADRDALLAARARCLALLDPPGAGGAAHDDGDGDVLAALRHAADASPPAPTRAGSTARRRRCRPALLPEEGRRAGWTTGASRRAPTSTSPWCARRRGRVADGHALPPGRRRVPRRGGRRRRRPRAARALGRAVRRRRAGARRRRQRGRRGAAGGEAVQGLAHLLQGGRRRAGERRRRRVSSSQTREIFDLPRQL